MYVFVADVRVGDAPSAGTFHWEYQAKKLTAVALKGMPAGHTLTSMVRV